MTVTEDLFMKCPPEVAFDAIADIRNGTSWNDDVSRAEMTTEEPVGQGSRFITSHGAPLGDIASTITVFDRPERIEFTSTSKRMNLDVAFTFTKSDAGTMVHGTFEPKPKGLMALVFPLLRPMIVRGMTKQHENLTAFCESRAALSEE